MTQKVILTGVKPTGSLHLGNYIGAIKPFLDMARGSKDNYLFIADYHALNALYDPVAFKSNSVEMAAAYLALGLNPDETVFYRQSDVPEVFELMNLLCAVTPKGLMDRAHSYKASVDKNRAEGKDVDAGVNMGLYTYPILMAADILAANTDIVPVGKDQVQHVEFARDIAGYFNNTFKKDIFKLPEYRLEKTGAILPGLDGRKMSKSYKNDIHIFTDSKTRKNAVMKIMTDSKLPNEAKNPDENIIYQLYIHFANDQQIAEMREGFEKGGMGYGDAKKLLLAAVENYFAPFDPVYNDYMAKPKLVNDLLMAGALKVRKKARETLSEARETVGLHPIA